jgi:hypothetical protein
MRMRTSQLDILRFQSRIGEERLRISEEKLGSLILKITNQVNCFKEPTARSFSDWVFALDHGEHEKSLSIKSSRLNEVRRTIANILDRNADTDIDDWDLISCDNGSSYASIYQSSVLTYGGEPLRMKPDAVWRNRETGIVAIFEYKVASDWVYVPNNGWPNLAVQLWAYAWADEWKDEPNIILLGAIFRGESAQLVKVVPRTVKSDIELNRSCVSLFMRWGGQIHGSRVKPSCRALLK